MTFKEVQEKCNELQKECTNKQVELRKRYDIEHNPIKVGDIVTDHFHTIKVEKMGFHLYPTPCMTYTGTELTKQGEPKKRQPMPPTPVYQNNVEIINGEPYNYVVE